MESRKELLVVALGGNALLDSHHKGTIEEKMTAASLTAEQLLPLMSSDYALILTHGNGPQVGNILLRAEYSIPIYILCHLMFAEQIARAQWDI